MTDELKLEIAEELCAERCAQMGDKPCSKVTPDEPHCDECEGMAMRVLRNLAAWNERHSNGME